MKHIMTYETLRRYTYSNDDKIKGEIKVVNARIDDLTREVRDHNNFARRVPVLEEQVKVLNARIGALESKI